MNKESGALAVIQSAKPPQLEDMLGDRSRLLAFFKKVLKRGIKKDYDLIPGTQTVSLLFPGAQKLLRFYQLYPRLFPVGETSNKDQLLMEFVYRCEIWAQRESPDGSTWIDTLVCQYEGSANSHEATFKVRADKGQKRVMSWDQQLGKRHDIRSRAMKRALVAATRVVTNSGDLFSQDQDEVDAATRFELEQQEHRKLVRDCQAAAADIGKDDWRQLTIDVLGQKRVDALAVLENPWEHLANWELNALLQAKDTGDITPVEPPAPGTEDVPPCGKCGKPLAESNAVDPETGEVICITCNNGAKEDQGQQTLV